jgi:large-conductance mechanosensitive channel
MLTVGENIIWREFKEFIRRGSVTELAIAVITGTPKADER